MANSPAADATWFAGIQAYVKSELISDAWTRDNLHRFPDLNSFPILGLSKERINTVVDKCFLLDTFV